MAQRLSRRVLKILNLWAWVRILWCAFFASLAVAWNIGVEAFFGVGGFHLYMVFSKSNSQQVHRKNAQKHTKNMDFQSGLWTIHQVCGMPLFTRRILGAFGIVLVLTSLKILHTYSSHLVEDTLCVNYVFVDPQANQKPEKILCVLPPNKSSVHH